VAHRLMNRSRPLIGGRKQAFERCVGEFADVIECLRQHRGEYSKGVRSVWQALE